MKKMHILLTNDDGVHADGLRAMYQALSKVGKVTVVAPDGERSSISQAITLQHPIYHREIVFQGKNKAHAVSGTPADCVKFAVAVLFKGCRPDMVVSGINHGSNDGCSVFYSGTVGAAREGALLGIPSLAVSLDCRSLRNFVQAASIGVRVLRKLSVTETPGGTFFNLNVPDLASGQVKGIRLARQCRVPIHGEFRVRKDPTGRTYYWMTGRPPASGKETLSDSWLIKRGYAVVAPIHCDTTNYVFLNQTVSQKMEF